MLEVSLRRVCSLSEKDSGSEKEEKKSSFVRAVYTVKFLFIDCYCMASAKSTNGHPLSPSCLLHSFEAFPLAWCDTNSQTVFNRKK